MKCSRCETDFGGLARRYSREVSLGHVEGECRRKRAALRAVEVELGAVQG